MIEYYEGTVFNTEAEGIVNTVNCKGVMGAGLALEYKMRYPKMYKDYEFKCEKNLIKIGEVDYFEDDLLIINFPTKYDFKYPSKLEWIERGLKNFVDTYKNYELNSVAFPKLGVGKGGLDWNKVKNLMEKYLGGLDIKVFICLDDKRCAEGDELSMLKRLNESDDMTLQKDLDLNKRQLEIIIKNKPYQRFWHISKLKGIGVKSYQKIFTYYYSNLGSNESEQLNIDDLLRLNQ